MGTGGDCGDVRWPWGQLGTEDRWVMMWGQDVTVGTGRWCRDRRWCWGQGGTGDRVNVVWGHGVAVGTRAVGPERGHWRREMGRREVAVGTGRRVAVRENGDRA